MHRDDVPIPEPCSASWDDMHGGERKRFCDHCDKHVHHLSALSEDEAAEVLKHPEVCVRYAVGADAQIRFRSRRRFLVGLAAATSAVASVPAVAAVVGDGTDPNLLNWAWDKVSDWWAGGCPVEGEQVLGEVGTMPVEIATKPEAHDPGKLGDATSFDDSSLLDIVSGGVREPLPSTRPKTMGRPVLHRPTEE